MKSNKAFNVVRVAAIVFSSMLASACAPLQQQQTSSSFLPNQLISIEISDFLSHSAVDSSASFAQSPWGENITLLAKSPYFSASGAECRQLVIESVLNKRTELACTQDKESWYKVRALVVGNTQ